MNSGLLKTTIILILLFLLAMDVVCEEYEYPFSNTSLVKRVWTTRNGLPQNTISSIIQTKDSYIWLATLGGIVRFDGVSFTNFEPSEQNGLTTSRTTALAEDSDGNLWIGTQFGDVFKFDGKRFQRKIKMQDDRIIYELRIINGRIWVLGERMLSEYNLNGKLLRDYVPDKEINGVMKMEVDSNGVMWFGSSSGLLKLEDGSLEVHPTQDVSEETKITGLAQDARGRIVASTAVSVFRVENNVNELLYSSKLQEDGNKQNIYEILTADDDSIWLSDGFDVLRIKDGEAVTYGLSNLVGTKVRSMFQDNEGTFWLGSDGGGLIQYILPRVAVIGKYPARSRTLAPVYAITQDRAGVTWIASEQLLSYSNQEYKTYTIRNGKNFPNPVALAVDNQDGLWVGTEAGLNKMINGEFTKVDPFPVEPVNALMFDRSGTLWIGRTKIGLQNYKNGNFRRFTVEEGLVNTEINALLEAHDGAIWVGTNKGFSVIKNEVFVEMPVINELADAVIRDFYEENDGTMWIATYGNGIFRYKNGTYFQVTKDTGLAENVASRLIADNEGSFWILGNQGISAVSIAALNKLADGKINRVDTLLLDVDDGMIMDEGNGGHTPAGWKMKDGKIWFPMVQGGVVVDPNITSRSVPVVKIEEVKIDNKIVENSSVIDVSRDKSNLEIAYTGLSYRNPNKTHFYYKMSGIDTGWIDAGNQRRAVYHFLPPGEYQFSVKALSSDGMWSNRIVSQTIRVEAPYWRTWWFILLSIMTIAGIFYLVYRYRLRQIRIEQKKEREFAERLFDAHESERHRIATELHDSLGQNLLVIKNWALQGMDRKNGKSVETLAKISDTATQSINETRTIVNNLRPQSLMRFGLTESLNEMIDQIESAFGIRFERKITNIDGILGEREEISVYRIIQESINNIVKHSDSPRVDIFVENQARSIGILIRDYGVGFDHLSVYDDEGEIGFGLANIAQRVKFLNGSLNISSRLGEGTTVRIILEK